MFNYETNGRNRKPMTSCDFWDSGRCMQKIREVARAKKIDRETLAKIAGVKSKATINNWENRPEFMPHAFLVNFARYCKMEVEEILNY